MGQDMTKYKSGAYTIFYFNRLGAKKKKPSKIYKTYGLARSSGDKWLLSHPEKSYVIILAVYNSKSSQKWDYHRHD